MLYIPNVYTLSNMYFYDFSTGISIGILQLAISQNLAV